MADIRTARRAVRMEAGGVSTYRTDDFMQITVIQCILTCYEYFNGGNIGQKTSENDYNMTFL